jgi:hypothetical protein
MLGSLLTKWTIRLALACLAAYFAGRLLGYGTRAGDRKFTTLRWIWTAGCVLFLAHVACAFQFTHGWSHTHAWDHTAAETKRLMGFAFGDGIYFSYFFLILWVVDVVCLWVVVARPWWLILPTYLFIFFIALNGAIVFEDGPTRPVGMVVIAALLPLAMMFVVRSLRRVLSQERKATLAEAEA